MRSRNRGYPDKIELKLSLSVLKFSEGEDILVSATALISPEPVNLCPKILYGPALGLFGWYLKMGDIHVRNFYRVWRGDKRTRFMLTA